MGVFHVALAQMEVVDLEESIQEALEDCRGQLAGRTPGAALLYADMDLDHQILLNAIQAEWPGLPLIGGTTDGEFSSRLGYTCDSFTLVLLASESAQFVTGALDLRQPLEDQCARVQSMVSESVTLPPRVGILLADGLMDPAEDALKALQGLFGVELPWTGALTADRWTFNGIRQFHGAQVLQGAAVFLMLCGTFRCGLAVGAGWRPIGRTGVVTRSEKNTVYEIDHAPALDFYIELMGEAARPSVETPTAVYDPCGSYLFLRASLDSTDRKEGSVRYISSIPEGSQVRVTLVDRDSIVEAVRKAMHRAKGMFGGGKPPSIALCFSCAARRVLLGSRTGDECRTACDVLGGGIPVAGFYSYGEIAPPEPGMQSYFHNETFVILLLP